MTFIEEFTLCISQFQKSTLNFINLLLNFEIKLESQGYILVRKVKVVKSQTVFAIWSHPQKKVHNHCPNL